MKRVVIIQRRLTHYRVNVFESLKALLSCHGICLVLVIGSPSKREMKKNDSGHLAWAAFVNTRYYLGERVCWQSIFKYIRDADLVIVTQENALLANHALIAMPRKFKLAFWGHGANLQSKRPNGFKERYKRWTTNKVDWWFAYTRMSADLVQKSGFPGDRITVLNNTVDTTEMVRLRQSIIQDELHILRRSLGFDSGPIGVFVGSLYADKRLDFLFAAAEAIHTEIHNFQFLIIGDGAESEMVQQWCSHNPWARWIGARFGREKVAYLSVGQIMLNPGLVGLGILDSFVCEVPMVTTNCGLHSPEIAYLDTGVNGIMTDNNMDSYVEACVSLLQTPRSLRRLRDGCAKSARKYTLENMVNRFADGIISSLACTRKDK